MSIEPVSPATTTPTPPRRVKRKRGEQIEEVAGPVPDLPRAPERAAANPSASEPPRPGRKSADALLEPYRDQLGTVDDGKIGELAGVSRGVVGAYRRKHGIKAYDGYLWTAGRDRRNGAKDSDAGSADASASEISAQYVADREEVAAAPPAAGSRGGRKAKKARRSRGSANARKPAQDTTSPSAAGGPAAKRRGLPSKLDAVRDLVGVLPDREVAERVGLTVSAVQMYRKKYGIVAASKSGGGPTATKPSREVEPSRAVRDAGPGPRAVAAAKPGPDQTATAAPVATRARAGSAGRALVAWKVVIRVGDAEVERYAVTADVAEVGRLADAAGEVVRIERLGAGLA